MQPDYVIQLAGQGKDWVEIMTALLTPTIAVVGAWLGYMQWRINKLRLTHELFEKRWKIYIAATDFIAEHLSSNKNKSRMDMSSKCLIGIAGCQFIFNDEIKHYLYRIETIGTTSPSEIGLNDMDKRVWLSKQLKEIDAKLGPFMRLS